MEVLLGEVVFVAVAEAGGAFGEGLLDMVVDL